VQNLVSHYEGGTLRVFENRVLRRISGHKYYLGDQVKEDEMGSACSTHQRDEKCIQNFDWKT
jgi:hypothetical protein